MEHNPFAPPKAAVLEAPAPPTEDEIASRTRRFINMVIDTVAQIVLMLVLMIIAVIVYPPFAESSFLQEESALSNYLLGLILMVVYYLPCEALFGRTLGKLITGTRVVDETGEPPSFKQILGRTFARLIPLEAFSFLKSSGIGAHDSLPGTRVVRNSYGRR
jgi:uncharacterized RDD family membrane protein YckC